MPTVSCGYIHDVKWMPASAAVDSLDNALHIWRLQLSKNLHRINEMAALLSAEEIRRAEKYHQEKDRIRFILSRGVLRLILARHLGIHAKDVVFMVGTNKKPFVESNAAGIHYNVSHSGDWVVIAVSDRPVGIDMENTATGFDYDAILDTCFGAAELEAIQHAADSKACFYLYWTRKEALLKATAKGIDDDLPLVPCIDGIHEVASEKTGSDENWSVLSFGAGNDTMCSVACAPALQSYHFYE